MPKPQSEYGYIQLNKTITQRDMINIVNKLSSDWLMSPQDVCYRFIQVQAAIEIKKRKELEGLIRSNQK